MKFPRFSSIHRVRFAFLALFVLVVWFAAYEASKELLSPHQATRPIEHMGDLATILFGAASLALFVISIFLAFLAIFGWGAIEEVIRSETKEELKALTEELRGRTLAISGFLMGESSVSDDYRYVTNAERLKSAIHDCEQAYRRLQDVEGAGKYMALNNLLEYSCILGDRARRGFLLEGARQLKTAGEEHDVPNLLLTSCRTVLTFGLDPKEIDQARTIVGDLITNPRLNPKEKREAEYLASLSPTPPKPTTARQA
jgi:hypothetical protein